MKTILERIRESLINECGGSGCGSSAADRRRRLRDRRGMSRSCSGSGC